MEALKENPHFQGPELFVNRHRLGATAGGVLVALEDARGEVKARRQPVYPSQAVALGLRRTLTIVLFFSSLRLPYEALKRRQ